MKTSIPATDVIPTHIKNPVLVQKRRRQIVDAAVKLFIDKGFHKTTTRQIAQATGFSIGTLYEYIVCKEDVLYLVCETIHAEVEKGIAEVLNRTGGGRDALVAPGPIAEYLRVCHRMSDHILLIYQETQSLPARWRKKVLENEIRITGMFMNILVRLVETGDLPELDERALEILAHDITVLGHMWTFRSWFLARHYSIDEYIAKQTHFIMGACMAKLSG